MHNFKSFNIQPSTKSLEGDKIKIDRILNKSIIVETFRVENSKFTEKGCGECLYLQIMLDNEKRVVFSGSANLIDMINRVPEGGFPFETTIIKNNGRFEFT